MGVLFCGQLAKGLARCETGYLVASVGFACE